MNAIAKIEEGRALTPSQQFRSELDKMVDQFAVALPSHIKPERFQRVVMTAVLSDPAVLNADRKSLMEAAIRAAQDGLLPDKREGAFVVFGKIVQWMPMIGGIIKKIHQSDEIAMLTAKVVYGGDTFRSWVDDEGEHVAYEQAEHPDYDTIRQVFALAKTKDGAVYVETLTPRDIDKIRNVSRSKDKGPWVQWWEEMAKKSAIRRLAKRLPLSSELHDLMQRDNDLYDLSQAPDPRPAFQERFAAAAKAAPALTDEREGFDASFVARETQALSEGSDDIEEQDPGSAPLEPEPEAGAIEAREEPVAAPASEDFTAEEQAVLRYKMAECIDKFIKSATDPKLDARGRQDTVVFTKNHWKDELPTRPDFVKVCTTLANDIVLGKTTDAAARAEMERWLP